MDTAWAVLVLSMLPGTPETVPPLDLWPQAKVMLQEVAIGWEVMDRRETSCYFVSRDDYQADVDAMRLRVVDLKNVPPVGDAERFPHLSMMHNRCQFNRAFRDRLIKLMDVETDRRQEYERAIAETDHLYRVWDLARDARCEFYYIHIRRKALKRLREEIGEELYQKAELPDNVPTWRFSEMTYLYR